VTPARLHERMGEELCPSVRLDLDSAEFQIPDNSEDSIAMVVDSTGVLNKWLGCIRQEYFIGDL
jgi:hypothetical protein